MPEIITREEAIARGLKRYFTGKPCPRGHTTKRYVSSRACVRCAGDNFMLYENTHRYYRSEYARWRNQQKRQQSTCRCGSVFTPDIKRRLYCSLVCREQAVSDARLARKSAKSCGVCGNAFTTNRSQKMYCSGPCQKAAARSKKHYTPRSTPANCLNCGSEFTSMQNLKCCSKECAVEHKRDNNISWKLKNAEKLQEYSIKRSAKLHAALRIVEQLAEADPRLKHLIGEIDDALGG